MKPLPLNPQLEAIARRTVWFKSPADAIAFPEHFIAHVLTYGIHEDVATLRQFVSDDELREALDHTPAGIFDPRSWSYWNLMLGRHPAPPMPVRRFPSSGSPQA